MLRGLNKRGLIKELNELDRDEAKAMNRRLVYKTKNGKFEISKNIMSATYGRGFKYDFDETVEILSKIN